MRWCKETATWWREWSKCPEIAAGQTMLRGLQPFHGMDEHSKPEWLRSTGFRFFQLSLTPLSGRLDSFQTPGAIPGRSGGNNDRSKADQQRQQEWCSEPRHHKRPKPGKAPTYPIRPVNCASQAGSDKRCADHSSQQTPPGKAQVRLLRRGLHAIWLPWHHRRRLLRRMRHPGSAGRCASRVDGTDPAKRRRNRSRHQIRPGCKRPTGLFQRALHATWLPWHHRRRLLRRMRHPGSAVR
jgi:hypothetical protein